MKSVLISIQPKYVELIAKGQKTIEVRKTRPKIETPFKCYIYKTKKRILRDITRKGEEDYFGIVADKTIVCACPDFDGGKVIGEFVCDWIGTYLYDQEFDESMGFYLNNFGYDITSHELGQTCLSYKEFEKYGNTNMLYGWYISKLKIYDKPKELSEFKTVKLTERQIGFNRYETKSITRPPQSWCYVEKN